MKARTKCLLGALALVASCEDARPPVSPTKPGPTGPSTPYVTRLEINGPDSVAPGQSAQFTAIERLSDGTTRTNPNVSWVSYPSGQLQVTASGVATAGSRVGEATLRAHIGGATSLDKSSTREIVIVPDGTYRLVGVVREHDTPPTPIAGARIEITGTALTATTDWEGRYRLYGVPGEFDVRVTKDGYQLHTQSLHVTGHVSQDFRLTLSQARLDLAGSYTLDVEATDRCAAQDEEILLPPELRRRSYAALITQTGSQLTVTLTEPRFALNSIGRGNRFTGRVEPGGATFTIRFEWGFYYYSGPEFYPDIAERLPNRTFLVVWGTAATKAAPSGLSGSLTGGMTNHPATFPVILTPSTGCYYSTEHRFTLSRR